METIKHLPRAMQKYFPIKTSTLKQFIERVSAESVEVVEIRPVVQPDQPLLDRLTVGKSEVIGYIGNFRYLGMFRAQTRFGRSIILDEVITRRRGSEYGIADSNERNEYSLRVLLTIISRAAEIKQQMPNLKVAIVTHQGSVGKDRYDQIQKDAARLNLRPFQNNNSI